MQNNKHIAQSQLYLFLLASFTFINVLLESNIDQASNVITLLHVFRLIVMAGLAIVIINNKVSKKNLIFLALMSLFALVNIVAKDGPIDVLTLLLIIFASRKVKLSSIFKTSIVSISFSYLLVIILSKVGIIKSVTLTRYLNLWVWKGGYTRTSLGFQFPNQVPLALFYVSLLLLVYYQNYFSTSLGIIILLLDVIVYSQCNARTPFLLTIILVIIGLLLSKKKIDDKKKKLISRMCIFITLVVVILSYIFPLMFRVSGGIRSLDFLFNHRISSSYLAIQKNGISLFGSGKIAGTVGDNIKNIFTVSYTLNVDNGFVIFLLQYGLLITLLYFYFVFRIINIAIKKKNIFVIFAIMLIAIANVADANLISLRVWPFFTVVFNAEDPLLYGQVVRAKHHLRFRLKGARARAN